MTTIGIIILIIGMVFAANKVQKKIDNLEWEIFQLKEKLKEKGLIEK